MKLRSAVASAVVLIGLAAPAYADDGDGEGGDVGTDKAFLAELQQAGLTYQDPNSAVAAGKSVCQLVDEGKSAAEIITELRNRNPSFQGTSAAKFTALAAAAYCPQYMSGGGLTDGAGR
ncbi:DUF732 domain-containing protein [Mycobacterium sp. IS-1264]|uniref:DUF732 domain-containing protein n=1 Tax=Mycobacterium sp. IS-1264 TaxID=1834158 RepID=UPI00096E241E|nr:DUF732 domain-containing protein [Mycobacterium sp. IS-1264]OMC41067.1 hypothetical protein A5744_19160 [Mycobacterium sp. IS-1264]